jgi:lipopolysaccharide export system permease protein
MTILDRYIASQLARGWLLLFALLSILFALFTFIDELDRNTLNYQTLDALKYVAMSTLQRSFDLAPIIALLGTLVACVGLARSNELVAILTTGIPTWRQMLSAAMPASLLMLMLWPIGEFVAAPLAQQAEIGRQEARSGGSPYRLSKSGLWSTDGQNFYHIGGLDKSLHPQKIAVYDLDASGQLVSALYAEHAEILPNQQWRLHAVHSKQAQEKTENSPRQLHSAQQETLQRGGFWNREQLISQTRSAPTMSLADLHAQIGHLRETGQNLAGLPHIFWQRLALPVTTAMMVLLGLQLCLSMLLRRDFSSGMQIGVGVSVSIFFYLSSQIIYTAGALLDLNAIAVALSPTLLIMMATLFLIRYQP